jgi:hypothetical protein
MHVAAGRAEAPGAVLRPPRADDPPLSGGGVVPCVTSPPLHLQVWPLAEALRGPVCPRVRPLRAPSRRPPAWSPGGELWLELSRKPGPPSRAVLGPRGVDPQLSSPARKAP